jgi:dienelactone hydrolase
MKTPEAIASPTRRALLLSPGALLCAPGFGAAPLATLDDLWKDFDPSSLPLEAETVQEWKLENCTVRKVYYSSEVFQGFKVRVVAYLGLPAAAGKAPSVLHIHGGGQTATREYVEYWARRGYAALSINWGGYALDGDPRNGNTDWGPIVANQRETKNTYRVRPDPRVNSWYHWAIACRRGLTFLAAQPEVDAERMGIFGISMGGRLTWMVAGLDDRVKAAASVYGAVSMGEAFPDLPGTEQVHFEAEDLAIWRATLETDPYVRRIRCPFLFLGASDDFYGVMDLVDRAIGWIPHRNRWQAYTPHFNHHMEPPESAVLPLWMDRWLKDEEPWPAAPSVRLELGATPRARVTAERRETVDGVRVFYSTDPYPQSRYWRSAEVKPRGGGWGADLPLTDTTAGLWAYGTVHYRSGLLLSSRMAHAGAEELHKGGARRTDPPQALIDDFRDGARDWFVPSVPPNPLLGEARYFEVVDGPDGGRAVAPQPERGSRWRMATRKTGDPKWRGPDGAALELVVKCRDAHTIFVLATENEYRRPKRTRVFAAKVPLRGSGQWERVRAALEQFQPLEGEGRLESWRDVNLLTFESQHQARAAAGDSGARQWLGEPWDGPQPAIARVAWVTG